MSLKVSKKVFFYILFWIACLLPYDVISLFPSYETYFQYILQGGLGLFLLLQYKMKIKSDIFSSILFIWITLYLPGAIFVSSIKSVTLIKYVCWMALLLGLLSFFENASEERIYDLLKAGKITFCIYMFLTFISMSARATDVGGVFFLGSRATTLQYFLCLLTFCIYYDIRYKKRISYITYALTVLSWIFAILRGSGQGMMMLFTLLGLTLLEYFSKVKIKSRIKPLYIIVAIVVVNYLTVTLSYMNFDFIIDIIQNVLHKDATLTGRSEIFTYSLGIMLKHPVIGYGYDNGIIEQTLTRIVAAYNTAHNSILQMLIDCGFVGTFTFLAMNYNGFLNIYKDEDDTLNIFYYSLIAIFVGGIVSMIIPSNAYFLILLFAVGRTKYEYLNWKE